MYVHPRLVELDRSTDGVEVSSRLTPSAASDILQALMFADAAAVPTALHLPVFPGKIGTQNSSQFVEAGAMYKQ
jgi:hypothetical protein